MLYSPKYFECHHKKLTKTKISNTIYSCDKCNREFIIIPAKNDPITLPIKSPKYPKPDYSQFRPTKPEYIKPF